VYKEQIKLIDQLQNAEKNKGKSKKYYENDRIQEFFEKFVGVSLYMSGILSKLIHDSKNPHYNKKKKEKSKKWKILIAIIQAFYSILYILFFIFTIISLFLLRPAASIYYSNLDFKDIFDYNNRTYLNLDEFRDDVLYKLDLIFTKDVRDYNYFISSLRIASVYIILILV
jgi:hypothetical protein